MPQVPRSLPWRSLWTRMQDRWHKPEPSRSTQEESAAPPASFHGVRDFLRRQRGERWFLTKRREVDDDELDEATAEEVEVVPLSPVGVDEFAYDDRFARDACLRSPTLVETSLVHRTNLPEDNRETQDPFAMRWSVLTLAEEEEETKEEDDDDDPLQSLFDPNDDDEIIADCEFAWDFQTEYVCINGEVRAIRYAWI
ncbi:hypothetical protein Poli38472_001089 [Pythium oligandrum]|uniref:Uncharacterized protein n=1 Tax=Pythium oligandrum TaxID=41045 RepID=A0A8K1CVC0_PYTOL|nr:hypothetical protein Poli38472_001089 [Pythium oligandrum]|eukprot:TMW68933.1 hypothetical protein Poli38472_001089 [Pythium oligandrum]